MIADRLLKASAGFGGGTMFKLGMFEGGLEFSARRGKLYPLPGSFAKNERVSREQRCMRRGEWLGTHLS